MKMIHHHTTVLITLMILALSAGFAAASETPPFPTAGIYDFYIRGSHAGNSSFTSKADGHLLIIKSVTDIAFGEFSLKLDSKTVIDLDSLRVVAYSYNGKDGDFTDISGTVKLAGDTISALLKRGEGTFPSSMWFDPARTIFFENYVAEHEILLARSFLASGQDFKDVQVFYPSDFMTAAATMMLESEIELETKKGPVLCTKIGIYFAGGGNFFSYIARDAQIPIYVDFPMVGTEIYSREYFGTEIKPRYVPAE